jgi:N-acyl-D-aspartate/D-glutamate deacylase
VVILNGRVMDPETGLDAIRNIGIRDSKIARISSESLQGRTTLDASGLVVSPGFIDLHEHGQNAETDAVKVADGVTTALELEVGVADVDAWYTARAKDALINFGASVGHIPVRMTVMHEDSGRHLPSGDAANRAATAEELRQIEAGNRKRPEARRAGRRSRPGLHTGGKQFRSSQGFRDGRSPWGIRPCAHSRKGQ